jgi:hypothetical protein
MCNALKESGAKRNFRLHFECLHNSGQGEREGFTGSREGYANHISTCESTVNHARLQAKGIKRPTPIQIQGIPTA